MAAFALSVAISPAVRSITFTPKLLVTLTLAGAGIVPLVVSVARPSGPQRASIYGSAVFLLVALAAALSSAASNIGIFGLYSWGTGWLMWLACAGAFAIGCRFRPADGRWLFGSLLAGALVNSVMALYQTLAVPTSATFGPYQGTQADGFLGNPIFLESLLLGVIALVSIRAAKSRVRSAEFAAWSASLGLMAVALEFSDERASVGLLVVLFLGLLLVFRAKGVLVALPTALGYLIGYVGGGQSLGGRVASGTSSVGFHQRLQIWRLALSAVAHRPFLGFGPGQFEAAIGPRTPLSLARTLQPGKIFTDGHDLVIEILVTTGLLGLAAFVVWVGGAIVVARNYFVFFALMCLAVELVEPLNIAITPLAFLALGAGLMPSPDRATSPASLGITARAATALCVAISLALGVSALVGDVALAHAPPVQYSAADAKSANSLLFYWPDSSASLTLYYRYEASISHAPAERRDYLQLALRTSKETSSRLPMDPLAWVSAGDSEAALGDLKDAIRDYKRALDDDPWCPEAFDGIAHADMTRRHFAAAAGWYRRELKVVPAGEMHSLVGQYLRDARKHVELRSGL